MLSKQVCIRKLAVDETSLAAACAALQEHGLIGFPTDTVYGIGARVHDASAIAEIFTRKGRDARKPLAVLCADRAQFDACMADIDETNSGACDPYDDMSQIVRLARAAADDFLPGPLTLVVPKSAGISDAITCGEATVGLRIPAHAWCRALLKRSGPLATTSANRSGEPPYLGEGTFPLPHIVTFTVADEPISKHASTVVRCTNKGFELLREGAISQAALAAWYARFIGQG